MRIFFIILLAFTFHSATAQIWEYAPLVNKAQRDAGFIGGEGGQWLQALAIDSKDGNVMLHGSDVGGLWRSINGGQLWEPANNGFTPRGTCGLFIDPNNPARAISVGSNSQKATWSNYHGLYLTTDTAKSWKQVLPDNACGYRDIREQIAYDPSSFDAEKGYSMIVYYSRIAWSADSEGGSGTLASGLYKSVDGGNTWKIIANTGIYGNSIVKVLPVSGYLFVANNSGVFKSIDHGLSFTKTFTGSVKGFDVFPKDPSLLYLCTANKIYTSADTGESFVAKTATGFTSYANYLRVSPLDDQHMITQHANPDDPWNTYYLFSHNGGASWTKTSNDNSLDFLPRNFGRMMYPSWHPVSRDTVFAVGGDFITKSTNGGASLKWANNGTSAIMSRGNMSFNLDNPDLFFFASQDYDASVSVDSGYTFKYLNMSGNGWGGDIHGGYIVDSLTWFGRKAEGWEDPSCDLRITFDGGLSYKTKGQSAGLPFCYGVSGDRSILFAGDLRSTDKGINWTRMTGCDGVIASDPSGNHDLYGVFNNTSVVRSTDHGASWDVVAVIPAGIVDLAYDHLNKSIYAACFTGGLWKVYLQDSSVINISNKTPADKYNVRRFSTVAVDPSNPEIVYSGGSRDIYSNDVGVIRSLDGGETWMPLTIDPKHNNLQFGMSSGRETTMIRVNPETGYAWCGSSCYGLWKIAQPDSIPDPKPKIRLNQSNINLRKDDVFQLFARIANTTDTIVDWSSGNGSRATVDENGLVTAVSPGSVTITAKTKDSGLQASCVVVVVEDKGPYSGTPMKIPGILQLENFDKGGEGIAYHDASPTNEGNQYRTNEGVDIEVCGEGGYNVGWTAAGEWLSYTVNVDSTMEYDLSIRAAVNAASKINITFGNGNISTGDINLAATGGWQTWQTFIKKGIALTKGIQELKLNIIANGCNLNYIQLTRAIPVSVHNNCCNSGFSVYPNPFQSGLLNITSRNLSEPASVFIYSVLGNLVYSAKLSNEKSIQIDRSYLEKGVYLVKYFNKDQFEIVKLLVK